MTHQRALLLQIMQSSDRHLTAEELFSLARQQMPHIAKGTVYRNLKLMEEDGEIRRLEMPYGADVFDRTTVPHGHLFCDRCGALCDYPMGDFQKKLEQDLGTEVLGYHVTIHYLCPKCRAQADT